ncbi:MAG: DUF1127 domain-containing protein [Aestuariivita sp.]|nr:DUF1127 domain-containing protein [Aestuariivita sp.]MCY4203508.1 DUF1127 domain-containing protein [Aestuariivita sp.]MCY4288091.1 DUF1127 domain-containing protein [Aestuariivita sp.]MCY4346341.1 DUF1127 domain-containing protein [Aestuariivita sp.]
MAVLDTARSSFVAINVLGSTSKTIGEILATIWEWNNIRLTRKALSRLSDRELDDIGVTRGDIETIAQHPRLR